MANSVCVRLRAVVYGVATISAWSVVPVTPHAQTPAPAARMTTHPRVAEAIRLADIWLDADVAYGKVPGLAVGVVYDQELVWAKGYGFADVARQRAVSTSTPFSICSISKLFTATAVMQLRDAGKLSLDDPIVRHLPGFGARSANAAVRDITVRQVLTHSSGLPRDFPYATWTGPAYPFPTSQQVDEYLAAPTLSFAPGAQYDYSNVGMTAAGAMVARVSGMSFDDYVRTRIVTPLGMTRTFTDQDAAARAAGLAQGFSVPQRDGTRASIPAYEVRGLRPVAGMVSTIDDLARFAQWQFRAARGGPGGGNDNVLRASTLAEMQNVQFMPADSWTMSGFGYQIWKENDRTFVGHAGTCPGAQSQVLIRAPERVAIIVLSNALGVETSRYAQRLYDVFAPAVRAAASPVTARASTLQPYTGLYQRPLGSETAVVEWQGRLALRSLPSAGPLAGLEFFEPVSDSLFRRSGDAAEPLQFRTDSDGRLVMVRGHQFMVRATPK